jgi:hypothetical protein
MDLTVASSSRIVDSLEPAAVGGVGIDEHGPLAGASELAPRPGEKGEGPLHEWTIPRMTGACGRGTPVAIKEISTSS